MTGSTSNPLTFQMISTASLGILAVLTFLAALFFNNNVALGIGAGGIISLANFFWLHGILQRVLGLDVASPTRFALVRFLLRFTLTAFAIYYLLIYTTVSIAGLLIGLSVIVITLIASLLVPLARSGG
jgi:hypothetical protein